MTKASSQAVYDSALSLLTKDNEGNYERLLQEILAWEEAHPRRTKYDGFEWHHVHGDARTLNALVVRGILDVAFKSNKSCLYKISNKRALTKALRDYKGSMAEEKDAVKEVPRDLFDIIVGHEAKKDLIRRSIKSTKPVPILLWGTPASAKTLMLEELSRLPDSKMVLGSSLTKAGLYEILFNERPTYLILDELDKIDDSQNLAALLSLMERGLLSETKYRRHKTIRLKCWVFASANETKKLPRELMSRFLLLRFSDYTDDEYGDVVVNVLRDREGISESLAIYISQKVLRDLRSKDVRDSVKISRLLKRKTKREVDYVVEILRKQK